MTDKELQSELDRILQTLKFLKDREVVLGSTGSQSSDPSKPGSSSSVKRKWAAIQSALAQSSVATATPPCTQVK